MLYFSSQRSKEIKKHKLKTKIMCHYDSGDLNIVCDALGECSCIFPCRNPVLAFCPFPNVGMQHPANNASQGVRVQIKTWLPGYIAIFVSLLWSLSVRRMNRKLKVGESVSLRVGLKVDARKAGSRERTK